MSIPHIAIDNPNSVDYVNQSIDKANQVDTKAAQAALDAANARVDRRATYGEIVAKARPGESGNFFSFTLDGAPNTLSPLTGKVVSDDGNVAALSGAGLVVSMAAYRIEPARRYRPRYVVRRNVNPGDPAGDAVRLSIRYLDENFVGLSSQVMQDVLDLSTSNGRQEYSFVISTVGGGDVDFVVPAGAVYARPFVQTFGSDGVTHVEIVDLFDLTETVNWSPDVSAFAAQVAILQESVESVSGNVAAANLLPDSYNETSSIDQQYGGWNWWLNGWPTFDTSGTHSGLKTPAANGPASSFLAKWHSMADLPFKIDDTITASVQAWFANSGGTITMIWRNDALASVGGSVASGALSSGVQTVNLVGVIPSGATILELRIQQLDGSAYQGIGYFACLGNALIPTKGRVPVPQNKVALGSHGRNLDPDPFFRLAERGIVPDAYIGTPKANIALADLAGSPFRRKKALAVTVAASAVDRWISIERLGLKLGDKLTVIVGYHGSQTVDMRLQFKTSGNITVVNSPTITKTIDGYDELRISYNITQTILDTADRLEIRSLLFTTAAADLYIVGYGVFVNSWPTRLHDDNRLTEIEVLPERQGHFNLDTLRVTRMKTRQMALGISAGLNIGVIGDSWTRIAARWIGRFAEALWDRFGSAGSGYYSFAWSSVVGTVVGGGGGMFEWPASISNAAHWTSTYYGTYGPALGHITATTTGATFTLEGTAGDTAVKLLYLGAASGQIRYRWNGGGWTTIAVSTAGLNWATLAGIPGVNWTLDIEVLAGLPVLCGLHFTAGTEGVRIENLAASGSKAQQYAAVDAEWIDGVSELALDLVVILHGTNDQDQYIPSLFADNLQVIIDNVREASPGCDIVIAPSAENNRDNGFSMKYYASAARLAAQRNKVAYADLGAVWGDDPDIYASDGPRPMMTSDLIHPDPDTGGVLIADTLMKVIDQTLGLGSVTGPASAVDGTPAVFNGTTGKLVKNITYAAFKTLLALVKGDVGLGNVDNTSDANKPVSTAQQAALDLKANLASPALTGTPTAPTASAATSTTQIATTAFTQVAIANYVAVQDVEVFKGSIDCSANPNYPAAEAGHVYRVSVAGKIGGASGVNVEVNDRLQCLVDSSASGNHATVGANWMISQVNIDGAVVGPASAVSGNMATFNGTSGKILQDSGKAAPAGTILGDTDTQFVYNKSFLDNVNWFVDQGDTTKKLAFQCVGIPTGTTITLSPPPASGALALHAGYQTLATDADFTLTPVSSPELTKHTGTLTANRTVTVSTTNAVAGDKFRITRTGSGAFNLAVGAGPLKNLVQNTWCEIVFDGSAWYLSAYGAL